MNAKLLEPSPAMNHAVEQVYAAFGQYRAPGHLLDVCTFCCMDAALEKEMRCLPLPQLTARHFYEYNTSAKSEVQPGDEIKYFLPRMLELLSQGAELHHSTELYLDRLGRCEADALSVRERAAIDAFAWVFFAEGLQQHHWQTQAPGRFMGSNAFDILLMFDLGGIALEPLLAHWLQAQSPGATLHYVNASYWDFWRTREIENAFAEDRPAFCETMKSWLLDARHRAHFARKMLALDVSAIDRQNACARGAGMGPKDIFESVFDLIAD